MKTPSWGRKAVGALIAVGVAVAAASPAMADKWNNPGHNKHWKHDGYYNTYYYQPRPKVVYVQPAPVVYVQPAPVYVAPPPPPPVYYVQPAPVYTRPSISIVLPIHID
ncbi:MAG: hypothetical protein R3D05_14910 [Dongiaceae bacterium]